MLLPDFNQRVCLIALDSLSRQWAALGVSVAAPTLPEGLIVDVEALLQGTFLFGRRDPRLFDEVLDWLVKNGNLVNVARLRRLVAGRGEERVLAAVCRTVSRHSALKTRWAVTAGDAVDDQAPLAPFFIDSKGEPLPAPRRADDHFKAVGFLRGPIDLRGMSRPFPASGSASLLLQWRALIGVSSRSEILCLLSSGRSVTPTAAARLLGYPARTLQQAMNEMARSHQVLAERSARDVVYTFRNDAMAAMVATGRPDFPPAVPSMAALSEIWQVTESMLQTGGSEEAVVVMIRAAVKRAAKGLAAADIHGVFGKSITAPAAEFLPTLLDELTNLIQCLSNPSPRRYS